MTRELAALAAGLAFMAAGGCGDAGPTRTSAGSDAVGEPWFVDRAAPAGVSFVHESGASGRHRFPEGVCGGACLFDADGDGDLDLYLVQAHDLDAPEAPRSGNALFLNDGAGSFRDVTRQAGVGDTGYGMGCACGDYDADGDVDLYVTNLGPNVLYRNEGDGTFTDVTAESGTGDPGFASSAAFADVDGDGLLDLFVVNYVSWSLERDIECWVTGRRDYCSPVVFSAPARDTLYRNLGDGTFSDASAEAGLGGAFGNGLGVAVADLDGDADVDVYVANDAMANQLWINDGRGRFRDRGLISGSALNRLGQAEAGMGVAAVDVDQDGAVDLFVAHLVDETNTLYINRGGLFEDTTGDAGLAAASQPYTGFGLGCADFDHDGLQDLYVANGRVKRGSTRFREGDDYSEPDQLYRGVGGGRFTEVPVAPGSARADVRTSRGAAFGDIDGDGDVDVVVVGRDAPPHLLINEASAGRSWILLRVLNERAVDASGVTVGVQAGGRTHWRVAGAGYGYCSSSDPRVHVGLGGAESVDEVIVRWPDGAEERFGPLSARSVHELRRGSGR